MPFHLPNRYQILWVDGHPTMCGAQHATNTIAFHKYGTIKYGGGIEIACVGFYFDLPSHHLTK